MMTGVMLNGFLVGERVKYQNGREVRYGTVVGEPDYTNLDGYDYYEYPVQFDDEPDDIYFCETSTLSLVGSV